MQVRLQDANHLGFLISQVHHVEQQAYMIQYPDIQYRRLVPVDTSAASWARGITHFSTNKVGDAKPLNHMSTDMPLVDLLRFKHEVSIEMAGIGYSYTVEELEQAMMVPGTNLQADGAAAAVRVSEEYVDRTVLYGNTDQGWDGLINNSAITTSTAPAGASGGRLWTSKTADEIIKDVNSVLTGVWHGSLTVELADTLCLPVERLSLLANTRIPDTHMNILEWIRQNNLYTMQTGQPLMITYIRGLESQGPATNAENKYRMLAYRNDPMVLRLHYPLPQRFDNPIRDTWFRWIIPGYFRLGGLEIRRPNAMRYMDQI